MALDPGRHLFMISAQTSQLVAYNPADLSQLPQGIPVYCIPVDLAADPAGRRLYVRAIISCGSSHHAEGYFVYDLDTLANGAQVGGSGFYGSVTRPIVIKGADLGAGLHLPYSGYPELLTFDGQSHVVTKKMLPYLGDAVALAANNEVETPRCYGETC